MAKGLTQAKTLRSLARLTGRSLSAVRKWVERDDWPFTRTGPWDVEKVKVWHELYVGGDPEAKFQKRARAIEAGTGDFRELSPIKKAQLQYIIERALSVRQRREQDAGKLHNAVECRERRLRQILAAKARLEELPRMLANTLVGLATAEIESKLAGEIRTILEDFSKGVAP
jgi:hypothetical protein